MVKQQQGRLDDDLHFQGRDTHEQFQFYFRQHWIRLLKPFFLTVSWSVVIIVACAMIFFVLGVADPQSRHGILIAFFAIFTVIHLAFLMRFYTYFLYVIVITDKRVHRIKKTLFSVDDHQTIDIWMFQDIHKWQHGPIQNVLGFGSLILEAQDTKLTLHFVPRIARIYGRLSHLREIAREKMMHNTRHG